ncbi:dual specificity protein phosphatase 3-like isoform X2 [Lineus longissimus]|uniref:dual specificity protein phosphatase 3-like isoform X2 n=1 Tax=Lineus longissimus TaxID=88925 RepID=UPI002B4F5EFE
MAMEEEVLKGIQELTQIIDECRPEGVSPVRHALFPTEVFPNLFLGQGTVAEDIKKLRDLGVTHVVNTAMGKKFTQINTNEEYYQPFKIKFYGFEAMDVMTYPIQKHFQGTADFIDQALKEGGKVFVHCHQGRSRSASIVLSYLMLYQGMTVKEAMKTVRLKREVSPNDGFIRRLCELNYDLQNKTNNAVSDAVGISCDVETPVVDEVVQNATVE